MDALNQKSTPGMRPRRATAKPSKPKAKAQLALDSLTAQASAAARMLKLIGNERRLLILCALAAEGEMRVGDLVDFVGLSQSALSQHLARLRADKLVAFRRQSQVLYYRVSDPRAARILKLLKSIYC